MGFESKFRFYAALLLLLHAALGWALAASPAWDQGRVPATSAHHQGCKFSKYERNRMVTSWEFQLNVPEGKCKDMDRQSLLKNVEEALEELQKNCSNKDFKIDRESLRTSVFDSYNVAISTFDGKPLRGDRTRGGTSPNEKYPWHGSAFLRYRNKLDMFGGNRSSGDLETKPGESDLTLKTQRIDLKKFKPLHEVLNFPECMTRSVDVFVVLLDHIEFDQMANFLRIGYWRRTLVFLYLSLMQRVTVFAFLMRFHDWVWLHYDQNLANLRGMHCNIIK